MSSAIRFIICAAIAAFSFMLAACSGSGSASGSSIPYTPLNDTGIVFGGNFPSGNNATCIGETIAQQDCSHGRDVTHHGSSDGHAGFSFTKLDASGNDLLPAAIQWYCVRDNVTGLIWQVKTGNNGLYGDEGLHDADDVFNWYNTDASCNGGSPGPANDDGATCHGYDVNDSDTFCNTQAFTARVNAVGYCGSSDWRMPTVAELESVANFGRTAPATDPDYFPDTRSRYYWTSLPGAGNLMNAWCVDFEFGNSTGCGKDWSAHIRLVRGGKS